MRRPGPSRPAGFQPRFLQTILILLAGFWVYAPCLHGEFLWDDDKLLVGNRLMYDPAGLWKIWFLPGALLDYYPLTFTLQRLEWNLWGEDTSGYHFINLVLHLASGFLVWRLFERLGIKLAFWGGLLFTVYPVNVESVAWISELKNTLSLPPLLLAMLFWIDYDEHGRARDYALALGLFVVAMLCKSSVVMLPLALLLYARWKRGTIRQRDLLAIAPFFLAGLAIGFFDTHVALQHRKVPELPLSGPARLDTAARQVFSLLLFSVFPFHLMPIYPSGLVQSVAAVDVLPWLALAGVLWAAWRHRSTWGRHVLLGLGFFLVNLVPPLVFIYVAATRVVWSMEHLVYISIIGIIGLLVAGLDWLHGRLKGGPRMALIIAAAACTAVLALGSWAYAGLYSDALDFWQYALRMNPGSWTVRLALGETLLKRGDAPDALEQFQAALRLDPTYVNIHYDVAQGLDAVGRRDEAIAEDKIAMNLNPFNPTPPAALGDIYSVELGNNAQALEYYQDALKIDPGNIDANFGLGSMLYHRGQFAAALPHLAEAAQYDPDSGQAHDLLGNTYLNLQQMAEAGAELTRAVQLAPDNATYHSDLGVYLAQVHQPQEAFEQFQAALKISPNDSQIHYDLGCLYLVTGNTNAAIAEYQTALRIDPHLTAAQTRLAQAQAMARGTAPASP
jgi:tetratricopeptide (TPR) repeat protein